MTTEADVEVLVYIPLAAINLSTWPSNSELCAQGLGLLVWTPAGAGVQTSSPQPWAHSCNFEGSVVNVGLGRQRRRLSLHIKSVVNVGASLFILKKTPYVKRSRAENPPIL